MRIAFDIHRTIDSHPEYFKEKLKELIDNGEQVYIISGPPLSTILGELETLGFKKDIHYHKVFSIVDFLKQYRTKMWQDEKGHWWCDDETWWASKSRICNMYDIDLLVDDKIEYSKHLSRTKFGSWDPVKKHIEFIL